MRKEYIEQTKRKIIDYIENGGSLYVDNVKNLPFYEALNTIRRSENDPGLTTFESLLNYLGFSYDREYYDYTSMVSAIAKFADGENYVDGIKKNKGSHLYTMLKESARKIGCNPSDYLILMTPYRYRVAFKQVDYIDQLVKEIYAKYPDGDVSRFKRENPLLYNKYKNLVWASQHEGVSSEDVAEFLGIFSNGKFSEKTVRASLSEEAVINEYLRKMETGEIKKLSDDKALYYRLNAIAVRNNTTVYQVFVLHGITPPAKLRKEAERLKFTKVDPKQREKELLTKRAEIMKREGITEPLDEREKYYLNKRLAILTIRELSPASDKSPVK